MNVTGINDVPTSLLTVDINVNGIDYVPIALHVRQL